MLIYVYENKSISISKEQANKRTKTLLWKVKCFLSSKCPWINTVTSICKSLNAKALVKKFRLLTLHLIYVTELHVYPV